MTDPSYQTVQLSRGRHASPSEGACVMELASMLAGEPFTDHPRTACPVLGMLLRNYNDGIDVARRQDLYWCAAAVVGTCDKRARQRRLELAMEFFGMPRTRWARLTPRRSLRTIGHAALDYACTASHREHRAFVDLIATLVGDEPSGPLTASERASAAAFAP